MKKFKYLLVLLCTFVFFFNVKADELEVSDKPFMFEDNLTVEKIFDTSAFLFGNNVDVDSKVDGISFIAGNIIEVKGTSEYSFIAGNDIEIYSTSLKDVFVAGASISFKEEAFIGRDAFFAASSIMLSGTVNGDFRSYSDSIELKNTTINGDVVINSSSIIIGENVNIAGEFKYNDDAVIEGEDLLNAFAITTYSSSDETIAKEELLTTISSKLINFLNLVILGVLICLLFGKYVTKMYKKYENLPFGTYAKQFGHGFLVLFVTPLLGVMLVTTTIGMSVGLVLLALYIMAIYISRILLAIIFGNMFIKKVLHKKVNNYLGLLIGLVVITLVTMIPYLGGLVTFVLLLLGLGVVFHLFKEKE